MSDDAGPLDHGDDDVKGDAGNDTADLKAMLETAEAEAAEAEKAAAAARAKVRAMRSEQPDDEADADEEDGRRRRPLWSPRWSVVTQILAAVVIVGCLAGSGCILWNHHQSSVRNARAAEFAAEASRGITAMTSLDFTHAKDDVQRIIDNATGSFKDDYEARADSFVKVVEESKVIARGTVTATAVQSMSKDEAVVLVAASQDVSNAAGNKAPRMYRFRVTVTRADGELKMSKAEFVP
ncbi:MAG TPA: hypothetical protein VH496_00015 [Mycobacterium sp.]